MQGNRNDSRHFVLLNASDDPAALVQICTKLLAGNSRGVLVCIVEGGYEDMVASCACRILR
jgi:hypothetical protein